LVDWWIGELPNSLGQRTENQFTNSQTHEFTNFPVGRFSMNNATTTTENVPT